MLEDLGVEIIVTTGQQRNLAHVFVMRERRPGLNLVWCGVTADRLPGPFFLYDNMNSNRTHDTPVFKYDTDICMTNILCLGYF